MGEALDLNVRDAWEISEDQGGALVMLAMRDDGGGVVAVAVFTTDPENAAAIHAFAEALDEEGGAP